MQTYNVHGSSMCQLPFSEKRDAVIVPGLARAFSTGSDRVHALQDTALDLLDCRGEQIIQF